MKHVSTRSFLLFFWGWVECSADKAQPCLSQTQNLRSRIALGIDDAVVESFLRGGINTLSKFAFCSSFVPGAADEKPFTDAMQVVLGRVPTVGELACFRRLFHEAYAMSAAELKLSVERTDDVPVKRLTQPERADRLAKQQARLAGLRIEGKLEPSDRLIDRAVSMYEENRLSYLELTKCTNKEQEVLASGSKDDKHMTIDASGTVKLKEKGPKQEADLSSDLLVRQAMMRRGLAFERVFDARLDDPPEGYSRISQQQVINADRKLFVKLAEATRSGIQYTAAGRPVELAFKTAMNHPDVLHLLQPLPTTNGSVKRLAEPGDDLPRVRKAGKGEPKGKSKGSVSIRMPQGLEKGTPGTPNQHPICFDYNLSKCKLPVSRGRCQKGLHVCCVKGCYKPGHCYAKCPKLQQADS